MTAVAEIVGGGYWTEMPPQLREQRNVISVELPRRHVSRDASGSFVMRSRAGVTVDSWHKEGMAVRAVARREPDLNGSIIETLFANATGGSSSGRVVPFLPPPTSIDHGPAERRVARLTEIQASLGLSMQTLADVLRISRAWLYRWFDAGQDIRLQEESAARLNAVEQLANAWRARSMAPLGAWLREPVGGQSLLDLLTSPNLPVEEVEHVFDAMTARFGQTSKSRSQRMREAGFSRRPTHRSLPSDE